ncbi:MAG: sensor histidine kinase [Gaiellales bacterium]
MTDAFLVVAILVLSIIGTFAGAHHLSVAQGLARLSVSLLAVAALWWRRRYPLVVLAVCCVASLIVVVIGGINVTAAAVAIALYTYASRTSWARAVLAGAAAAAFTITARVMAGAILPDATVTTLVLLGAICTLGLYVGTRRAYIEELTRRAERAERDRELLAQQAAIDERARIARELHDVIAHHVSLMVVQAGALRRRADGHPESAGMLDSIAHTGREALGEMRRMLGVLRPDATPADREPQPSLRDIPTLARQMRAGGLDVALAIEGEARALPPGVDLAAYRVIQEALTNVVKHAGVSRAELRIRYEDDAISFAILDNGVGQHAPGDPRGHGLVGMRERVALYNGTLSTGPRPGGGFAVEARLPTESGDA